MSKQFTEFQLHDIFYIESSIRLKSADHIPGNTPFISSRSGNNGISAWVGNMNESLDSDVLGVNYNGSVLEAYYHPYKALFSDDVKRFKVRQPGVTFRAYLYCATAIRKLKEAYSYTKKFNGDEIDVARIKLPIADASVNTDTPEPDWEYMENYIKTIERKYIDQIAQVNAREQEILKQLYPEAVKVKPEAHGFEEFRVGDVFEITPTKKPHVPGVSGYVDDEELLTRPGRNPYIVATASNNGIKCWTSVEPENKSGAITISTTADSSNTIFYQPVPFVGRQQIAQIRKKENAPFTKHIAFYVMTLLRKHTLYSNYGNKLTKEALRDFELQLPITPSGDIDWDYMENYIAWIETQERESRRLRAAREEKILAWLHQQH